MDSEFAKAMDTENTLLDAARRMDEKALVKIFDLYSASLFNYVRRLCSDPVIADHIVGDVFAKLLEQLSAGKGPKSNLRAYLYQSAYHQLIDEAHNSHRCAPLEIAESLRPEARSAFLSLEDQIMFQQILHAIRDELTGDQRHVIFLRFFEEFSLQETAVILGKNINHVKVIQSRALAALRRAVERQEINQVMASSRIRSFSKVLGIW
ncbi:MAG TPA: RNA polymerase sigma factor [Anaerolineales bacterium]|nr:RNA polymerase sigma factor [Anaerolineales bacterium]